METRREVEGLGAALWDAEGPVRVLLRTAEGEGQGGPYPGRRGPRRSRRGRRRGLGVPAGAYSRPGLPRCPRAARRGPGWGRGPLRGLRGPAAPGARPSWRPPSAAARPAPCPAAAAPGAACARRPCTGAPPARTSRRARRRHRPEARRPPPGPRTAPARPPPRRRPCAPPSCPPSLCPRGRAGTGRRSGTGVGEGPHRPDPEPRAPWPQPPPPAAGRGGWTLPNRRGVLGVWLRGCVPGGCPPFGRCPAPPWYRRRGRSAVSGEPGAPSAGSGSGYQRPRTGGLPHHSAGTHSSLPPGARPVSPHPPVKQRPEPVFTPEHPLPLTPRIHPPTDPKN